MTFGRRSWLYDKYIEPSNGIIKIPGAPGFGREPSEEAIEKYRMALSNPKRSLKSLLSRSAEIETRRRDRKLP